MPKQKRDYKERRLYFFKCEECGSRNRRSFKRSAQKAGLCRKCLRNQPPVGQDSLFSGESIFSQTIGKMVGAAGEIFNRHQESVRKNLQPKKGDV